MPRKRTRVVFDPNASLVINQGEYVCSCGKHFKDKRNAHKHLKIHKTRECTKGPNNICMKKWRHVKGDCHIGTESGYIALIGPRKWGCKALVLITNEDDNTLELRECGHVMKTDPQFKYHNKAVHKFNITNTTAAQLKKEIEEANEKLRKEFLRLTATTDAITTNTTINATNTANTGTISATNAASITSTQSVNTNSNKNKDSNCNKSENENSNINCRGGDNNVCFKSIC